MPNMTLSIPKELHKKMKKHPDIKWSAVARQSFEDRLQTLEWMDEVLKNSKLTRKDAVEIGRKVKKGLAKRVRDEIGR